MNTLIYVLSTKLHAQCEIFGTDISQFSLVSDFDYL